jgi:hypothetical protein
MPKFNLLEDKSLIVRGQLVSFAKGELETDDETLIKALKGAMNVELVTKKPTAAEVKAAKEAEAAELAEAERLAAEQAEVDRLAAEQAEKDKAAE